MRSQAIWVIMDPWIIQPRHDYLTYPNINASNKICSNLIIEYLPCVKNWIVSCEELIQIPQGLDHIKRVTHGDGLENHMISLGIKRIVYVGFHWGRCILGRYDGAVRMSKKYKCYSNQDLCGAHPEDLDQEFITEYSKNFLKLF